MLTQDPSRYNRVNGTHVSENPSILQDIFRKEWKSDALLMSDWYVSLYLYSVRIAGLHFTGSEFTPLTMLLMLGSTLRCLVLTNGEHWTL